MWEFDTESIFYDIEQERKDKGLIPEFDVDIDIDYTQYENDIVELIAQTIESKMSNFINKIDIQNIIHPKEYNFKNDSVDVLLDVNIDKISNFIYKNKDKFTAFLKERYTSYDGFISRYDNDFQTWESDTKKFTDFNMNGHYLGSILDFIAYTLGINESSIYEDCIENIFALDYVLNYADCINFQYDLKYYFKEANYTDEIADYLINTLNNGFINELPLNEETLSILNKIN